MVDRTRNFKIGGAFTVFLLGLFFLVYDVGTILSSRPTSIHAWRQTDCASLAYMYHAKDIGFLEPEMHNYISDGGTSGRTAGEFPGLYWTVGKLYDFFGFEETIYRVLGLGLFLAALVAVFLSVSSLLDCNLWGLIVACFLATSPVLVFYSSAFLTNVPAFAFTLLGWSFVFQYSRRKSVLWLIFAILSFSLGGLLKVTALISFLALGVWWLAHRIAESIENKSIVFKKPHWLEALSFLTVLAAVFAWYAYAESYVDGKLGKYTFNDVWPLWEMSEEAIDKAISFFDEIIFYQITSPLWWILLAIMTLLVLVYSILKEKRFLLFLLVMTLGVGLYLVLWFNALDGHDYYVINLMILPTFILVGGGFLLKQYTFLFRPLKWLLILALFWNIGYARNNFQMRYWPEYEKTVQNSEYFGGSVEVGFWRYFGEHRDYDVYHDLEPELEALGIDDSTVVISLPDPSFCISLYFMNREGFSNMSCPMDSASVQDRINLGADALIVHDSLLKEQAFLSSYTNYKLGVYKELSIYNLKPFRN